MSGAPERKVIWALAYLVALHAEASKPRHESQTWHGAAPIGALGGGGMTINRTEESDTAVARRAADRALEHFDQVFGGGP